MTEKFLVIDIETCNKAEDALAYDVGFMVTDRNGKVYYSKSFLVYDTFVLEKSLMQSAYYAKKIPQYEIALKNGEHELRTIKTVRKEIHSIMTEYSIKKVFAFNAYFDCRGLDRTIRYVTKSQYRYFFPYGTKICCIWNFACSILANRPTYKKFCEENNYISNKGKNYRATAEVVYQYITKDDTFSEAHTGLEDVRIESQILAWCYRQHKKVEININRGCWRKIKREV